MQHTKFHGFKVDERALKTSSTLPADGFEDTTYIIEFFNYLKSLPNEQREKFLQFATGTNRPPLLGFKYMYPNICLSKTPVESIDVLRLPTASTCANMIRLPFYGTTKEGLA